MRRLGVSDRAGAGHHARKSSLSALSMLSVVVGLAGTLAPAQALASEPTPTSTAVDAPALRVRVVAGASLAGAQAIARARVTRPREETAHAVLAQLTPLAAGATQTLVDTFGDGDTIVRFEQTHRGLPVIGRGATVHFGASGAVKAAVLALEDALPSRVVPTLASADAAGVASAVSPIGAKDRDAHLVVWPTRAGARLAYAVLPLVPTGLPTAPRVIVDAQTGEVLEARDLATFAKAQVYPTNPVKSPALTLLDLPISPAGETLTDPFLVATNCIDKKSVRPVSLGGTDMNLHVCDLVQTAKPDGSGNFVFAPSDEVGSTEARTDTYSELSIYYHAGRAYQFFRGLQGSADAQVVVDKPLRAIANLQMPPGVTRGDLTTASDPNHKLDTFQNAFFSPAAGGLGQVFEQLYGFEGGALWFGQGPKRDYAYDGDVVYHEFTHAVVDQTLKLGAWTADERGVIDAPGAMNEGLADFFSSALAGDPDVGEYAAADITGAASGPIRTLANQDRCPSAVVGEVHFDSTLFSGALWQARAGLSEADRTKFDAALYKAMRLNPGHPELNYDEVVQLFATTLDGDFPAGAAALRAAATERGILPRCERILDLAPGKKISSPLPPLGFAAPGLATVHFDKLAPGIFQVKVAVENVAKVTLSFTGKKSAAGGGALGGGGTSFTPVVLAKFGTPITWNPNKGTHDADAKQDATGTGTRTASFDVPAGATSVYLQIGNKGDQDGAYDGLEVELVPRAADPNAGADANGAETTSGVATAAPVSQTTESGCAMASASRDSGALYGAGALVAAAALLGARRRRSSR